MKQRRSIPAIPLLLFCLVIAVSACWGDDGNLKEIGTIAVDDYSACPSMGNVTGSHFCDGLEDVLAIAGGWTEPLPFPIRNIDATSGQIDGTGTGQNLGDAVDFFVFTGHAWEAQYNWDYAPGPPNDRDYGAAYRLASQHDHPGNPIPWCECNQRDCGNINHKECRWGNDDNEVVLAYTCQFLRNLNKQTLLNQIKYMHNRNHIILGFASNAYFLPSPADASDFGAYLGWQLMGHNTPYVKMPFSIIFSWFEACYMNQPGNTLVRVHYWNGDCFADFLPGNIADEGFGAQPPACTYQNRSQFTWLDYRVGDEPYWRL